MRTLAVVAKLADASDLGSDGKPYGFESLRLHHNAPQQRCFLFAKFVRVRGVLIKHFLHIVSVDPSQIRDCLLCFCCDKENPARLPHAVSFGDNTR